MIAHCPNCKITSLKESILAKLCKNDVERDAKTKLRVTFLANQLYRIVLFLTPASAFVAHNISFDNTGTSTE